ncbi:hypothetical protein PEC301879_05780 [Pectobacterium carotovorum subsp. carotovorum]|nr:hypothetical protein PEC301879_05780 [Pectobacterium carotovorum subsp. carotovorum]
MNEINDTRLEVIGFGSVPASVNEQRVIARELILLRAQVAELTRQEPFMHGIANPDGDAYFDECCVGDAGLMSDEVARLNDDLEGGEPLYSVVELFRRPVPPAATVPDEAQSRELFETWFSVDCSFDRSPKATDADNYAWKESLWHTWEHCRAAMLKAGDA